MLVTPFLKKNLHNLDKKEIRFFTQMKLIFKVIFCNFERSKVPDSSLKIKFDLCLLVKYVNLVKNNKINSEINCQLTGLLILKILIT